MTTEAEIEGRLRRHRTALIVITSALMLDTVFGFLFAMAQHIPYWVGLYCALANAVTVGGTVSPSTHWGYAITAAECILVVPLFAATFSLLTSGMTSVHVKKSEKRIKDHVEARLKHHFDEAGEETELPMISNTSIETDFDDGDNGSPEARKFGFCLE